MTTTRRGPQKGSKFCDLLETLKFLDMFKKTPKNVYQIYHSSLHFDPKKAGCRLNWGTEKPEVKLEDIIRLAEISADHETSYVRPEEVRKNLIKAGFELWETNQ